MNKINANRLTVSLTTVVIALLAQQLQGGPTPPGPDVRVVNTQTNPVPVSLINPGTNPVPVSVINFPAGTNTVNVSSSTNAPLLVRDVDKKSGKTPFLAKVDNVLEDGTHYKAAVFLESLGGKRTVIESVGVEVSISPNQNPLTSIEVSDGNSPYFHFPVPLTRQGSSSGGFEIYVASLPIRLNSLGSYVTFVFERTQSTAGSAIAKLAISGYFED